MSDFDLSKITGNEPPLITDDDKDDEIERLRAELDCDRAILVARTDRMNQLDAEIARLRDQYAVLERYSIAMRAEWAALRDAGNRMRDALRGTRHDAGLGAVWDAAIDAARKP